MPGSMKAEVAMLCNSLLTTAEYNLASLRILESSLQAIDEKDNLALLRQQAYAFYYAGHDDQARKAFNSLAALTVDPDALVKLAQLEFRLGRAESALDFSDAAIRQSPDNPLALIIKASALLVLGRPDEARGIADEAKKRGADARAGMIEQLSMVKSQPPHANTERDTLRGFIGSVAAGNTDTLGFSDAVHMVARMEALSNTKIPPEL